MSQMKEVVIVQEKLIRLKEIMSSLQAEEAQLTRVYEAVISSIKATTHPRWIETDLELERARYNENWYEVRGKIYGLNIAIQIIEDEWENLR